MPTLRAVLADPRAFDPSHALYAVKATLGPDSHCLLLDPDDVDDIDDVPDAARAAGYDYVLMMNDVRGVVANLLDQTPRPSDALRFAALRFYLDRDAYLQV